MAMDPSLIGLSEVIEKGGLVIGMVLILIGGYRRWWVFGHHYAEKDRECEQWKQLALNGHLINQHAISTLSAVVKS